MLEYCRYNIVARWVRGALAVFLALTGWTSSVAAADAEAGADFVSLWGYTGLVMMPSAHVMRLRGAGLGAQLLSYDARYAPTVYGTFGVLDRIEASLVYGVPARDLTGLTGHIKYQLVQPTRERPIAVAVGLSLIGVASGERYVDGNNLYLVVSQDIQVPWGGRRLTVGTGHFGFSGNPMTDSRMMGGMSVPIGTDASLVGEYLGSAGVKSGVFNLGLSYRLFEDFRLRVFTMGLPDRPWTEREWGLGLGYLGQVGGDRDTDVGRTDDPSREAPVIKVTPAPRKPNPLPSEFIVPLPPRIPDASDAGAPLPANTEVPSRVSSPSVKPLITAMPSPFSQTAPITFPTQPSPTQAQSLLGDASTTQPFRGNPQVSKPLMTQSPNEPTLTTMPTHRVTSKPSRPLVAMTPLPRVSPSMSPSAAFVTPVPRQSMGPSQASAFKTPVPRMSTRPSQAAALVTPVPRVSTGPSPSLAFGTSVPRTSPAPSQALVTETPVRRDMPRSSSPVGAATASSGVFLELDGLMGMVAGTLLDERGRALPGWMIRVKDGPWSVVTEDAGRFRMRLPLGPHELIVQDKKGDIYLRKMVRLISPRGLDLQLSANLARGSIKGIVRDRETRAGLSGATVRILGNGENRAVQTGATGSFSVADVPRGTFQLQVTRPQYDAQRVTVQVQDQREDPVVVDLASQPGLLSGRVVTAVGAPFARVEVLVDGVKRAVTDQDGHYTFKDVSSGKRELVLVQSGRRLLAKTVEVKPGAKVVENFSVAAWDDSGQKPGVIAGLIVDGVSKQVLGGVKLVVEGQDLTVLTLSDAQGKFNVTDLPPGRYAITASRPRYQKKSASASVTAQTGAWVTLALQPLAGQVP